MSFSIIPSSRFKKEAKRLAKKYTSLKQELTDLSKMLAEQPDIGTPLGSNIYKIRIAIKSKNKGKSGGARIITYVISEQHEIYLLTIYDKSEFDSVDDRELQLIITSLF